MININLANHGHAMEGPKRIPVKKIEDGDSDEFTKKAEEIDREYKGEWKMETPPAPGSPEEREFLKALATEWGEKIEEADEGKVKKTAEEMEIPTFLKNQEMGPSNETASILDEEIYEDKPPASDLKQSRTFASAEEITLKGITPPADERIIKSKPPEDERIIKVQQLADEKIIKTQPLEDERILKVRQPAKEGIIERTPERFEPKEKPIMQEGTTHERALTELEESRKTYLELHRQLEALRSEGYKLTTSAATFGGGGIDTKKVFENEALKRDAETKMNEALKAYESAVAKIAKGEYMARMEKLPASANESEEERKIRGEISKKYFIDERDFLKNAEKENKQKDSPIILKALQKFSKLPKWARYVASAAIATGIAVTGGAAIGGVAIGSSVALTLGFGTYKVGRAYLASLAVVGTERLGSLAIKKHLEGYRERKIGELERTGGNFIGSIEDTRAKYEKAMKEVERRGKWLNLAKWLTAIGVGGSTMLIGGVAEQTAGFTKPQFEGLGKEPPAFQPPDGPIDLTPPNPSSDYGWGISVEPPKPGTGSYPYVPGDETPHSNFRFPGDQNIGGERDVLGYPPSKENLHLPENIKPVPPDSVGIRGASPDSLGVRPDTGKVIFPQDSTIKVAPPESLGVRGLGPDSTVKGDSGIVFPDSTIKPVPPDSIGAGRIGPDSLGRGPDSSGKIIPPDSSGRVASPESLRISPDTTHRVPPVWHGEIDDGSPHPEPGFRNPSDIDKGGGIKPPLSGRGGLEEAERGGSGVVKTGPAIEGGKASVIIEPKHEYGKVWEPEIKPSPVPGEPAPSYEKIIGSRGGKLIAEQEEIRKLAAVRKGEGVWNPVRRQFEHLIEQKQKIGAANLSAEDINELKKLGIKPEDLDDVEKIKRGINRATYNFLVEKKFIDPDNVEEIRVSAKGIGKEIFIDEYKEIGEAKSALGDEHAYGWHPEMEEKPKIVEHQEFPKEFRPMLPSEVELPKTIVTPFTTEDIVTKPPTPTMEWANQHEEWFKKALKNFENKKTIQEFQKSSLAGQERWLENLSDLKRDVGRYQDLLKEQAKNGWNAPDKEELAQELMKKIEKLEEIHDKYEYSYAKVVKNKLGLSLWEYKKTMVDPLGGEQPTAKGIINLYNENPKTFDPKFLKMARFLKKVVGAGKGVSDTMKVDELIQKVAAQGK